MAKEQTIKSLNELTLLDRFLFAEVMDDPIVNRLVLEIIFDKDIRLLDWTQTEKEIRISPQVRNIRIDVYSRDEAGNVFDTEVQKRDEGNLPKRSRLYQGLIDSTLLPPGVVDYNEMKDCYIIIISPFDLIGEGYYRYTFRMRCDELRDCCLEDGGVRIFLNTRGTNADAVSPELVELLHYIEHATGAAPPAIAGEKLKQIHQRVQAVRHSEETGVRYMQLWEEKLIERQEARAEGLKEGLEAGRKLTKVLLIRENFNQGKTPETIAAFLNLDDSIVTDICKKLETEPDISDEVLSDMLPEI